MRSEIFYLLLLAGSPLGMFAVHMITARVYHALKPASSPLFGAIWAVAISFLFVVPFAWNGHLKQLSDSGGLGVAGLYGILVYILLGGCYYVLFAMTEAARRIKMMQEIYVRGTMSREELNRDYGSVQLFSARLERLVALGQLEKRTGRYYLKGKLLYYVAKGVLFLARMLKFS